GDGGRQDCQWKERNRRPERKAESSRAAGRSNHAAVVGKASRGRLGPGVRVVRISAGGHEARGGVEAEEVRGAIREYGRSTETGDKRHDQDEKKVPRRDEGSDVRATERAGAEAVEPQLDHADGVAVGALEGCGRPKACLSSCFESGN